MIDHATQQKIKEAANIVEVVGDYVKLTRRGANYMGLCPFHNERTPSFSVSPRRNFCHCFSCKKGGSPVNFLMEKEGIGYQEALLMLAKKYNIPVQERELTDEERRRLSEREAMLVASEWAMNFFHDYLLNSDEGRDIGLVYLYQRGITDEAIRKFKIGFSPDSGDALIKKARSEGFDLEVFKSLGLVGTSQSGRDYDRFRGRVMFPIRNASGKPVAFGGRGIKGEAAKYINSPETLLYKKSNELYGIFEAKPEITRSDRVYLMEGYLDVIGSWQAGIRNAVASSGTALTESQIALIHRFTDNVTLIYDGDSAGIKASLRGIDMLLAQKLHVSVLLLPEGEDPDSFAKKHSPQEFIEYIESHQTDFINYKLGVLLKGAGSNPQEISAAVRSVVSSIASIPDEIERISYIKECARKVGIDEKVISRQVAQALLSQPSSFSDYNRSAESQQLPPSPVPSETEPQTPPVSPKAESQFVRHEREILKYCVRYGFLPLQSSEEDSPSVLDFVAEELEADGLSFSTPLFSRVFDILRSEKDNFHRAFSAFEQDVEIDLAREKGKFQDALRSSGGTMAMLKAAEENYAAQEAKNRLERLRQFTIGFSVDVLINHEDSEVRAISNELVAERHVLSSIYTRGGNQVVAEEDRLSELLTRAISELRSEILNEKVATLRREMARALQNNDPEEQQRLMSQLSKVLYLRSRIAENLGERIISPR